MYISNDLKEKILKAAHDKARELALEARESMTNEYLRMIKLYYSEEVFRGGTTYDPQYYYRYLKVGNPSTFPDEDIRSSGFGHTFKGSYWHNSRKTLYVGGITISPEFMSHEEYNGTYEQVLYSILNGWHGLPGEQYSGIRSKYKILDHMLEYKKKLKKEIGDKFEITID